MKMPIYTYKCEVCGEFTKLVKIDERDSVVCQKGHSTHRKIDRPGGVYAPTSTGGGLKV